MTSQFIQFDPRGDVKLQVGHESVVIFHICSRSLARVSSTFDLLLYGKINESGSDQENNPDERIIRLPEEKPDPMEILLSITHGNFHRVPKTLSIEALYDLTILTHAYDATQVLGPWVATWMTEVEKLERRSNNLKPQILWIAWELGQKPIFLAACRHMLLESDATFFSTDDLQAQRIHFPPDIIEHIAQLRIQTIQSLLGVFNTMAEYPVNPDESLERGLLMPDSIISRLAKDGFWPIPDANGVEESVMTLYLKMANLVMHDMDMDMTGISRGDHGNHNPARFLFDRIQIIMGGISSPVMNSHLEYMVKQALKLGY